MALWVPVPALVVSLRRFDLLMARDQPAATLQRIALVACLITLLGRCIALALVGSILFIRAGGWVRPSNTDWACWWWASSLRRSLPSGRTMERCSNALQRMNSNPADSWLSCVASKTGPGPGHSPIVCCPLPAFITPSPGAPSHHCSGMGRRFFPVSRDKQTWDYPGRTPGAEGHKKSGLATA